MIMKTILAVITIFTSISIFASNSDLSKKITHLYESGAITEGEYSVLEELSRQNDRKIKIQSESELRKEQLERIEKLRIENAITEGEYSVLLEVY